MRVFISIAEHGSFDRAAMSLNMSNAVVTRYVALLEAHLETQLINRNTRSASHRGRSRLCTGLPADPRRSGAHRNAYRAWRIGAIRHVAPRCARFVFPARPHSDAQYLDALPKVRLSLTRLHRSVDLIEEGFDAVIVAPRQVSGDTLIRRPHLSVAPVAIASPAYLARHATPQCPADLPGQTLLAPSADVHGNEWHFEGPGGAREPVLIEPAYAVNNSVMLRQAAIAGMGITILPANQVAADLASGQLVHVLAGWDIRDAEELSLVYPGRRHVPAKTRSFVDFTAEWFRRHDTSAASAITSIPCNS